MRTSLTWIAVIITVAIAIGLATLFAWRALDHRADQTEIDRLVALQPKDPAPFSD